MARRKRGGRVRRTFERVAIGTVMGAIALILERRLLKAVRGRGGGSRSAKPTDGDLTVSSKDVDDQTGG